MEIADTYRDVRFIEDGMIEDRHGRRLNMLDLVKRRWGWPKKAATLAARWIFEHAVMSGSEPARIWVMQPERGQQQQLLFSSIPELLDALLAGLANGSSREALDCDNEIAGVHVNFTRAVTDDGFIRDVIEAIARRMNVTAHEVRAASTINTTTPVATLRVDVAAFDEGAPHVLARPDSGAT